MRWMLGHALASVLPQNVLTLGLPESEGRVLWEVLLGVFGPPSRTNIDRTHAHLADMLWQTLTPRAQRRLKELLGNDDPTPFELVVERANQSGRRVGMFLTGDFAHAAKTVLNEHPAVDSLELSRPGGLAKLCAELPSLADLVPPRGSPRVRRRALARRRAAVDAVPVRHGGAAAGVTMRHRAGRIVSRAAGDRGGCSRAWRRLSCRMHAFSRSPRERCRACRTRGPPSCTRRSCRRRPRC